MNDLRDFLTDPVVIFLIVFVVLSTLMFRWFLKRMEMNPVEGSDDLAETEGSASLADATLQSKVGTPRARRLQPARAAASELNLPELNTASPAGSEAGFPADSLAMAGETAFAKSPEPAKLTSSILPDLIRKETVTAPVPPGKAAAGTLPPLASETPHLTESVGKKVEPPAGSLVPAASPAEPRTPPTGGLPPLAPASGPVAGAAPEKKAVSSGKPDTALPLISPLAPVPLPPVSAAPAPVVPPIAPAPATKVEPVPVVKSPTNAPTPLPAKPVEKSASAPSPIATSPADSNDVKKTNTPPPVTDKPEAANSGLILIPKTSEAVAEPAPAVKEVESKADLTTAPAKPESPVPPVAPVAESPSFLSKMMGRPRIFMPATLPTPPKPEPETIDKAKPSPAAAEGVPETPAALADSKPPVVEAPPPVKSETPASPVSAPAGSLTIAPEKPSAPPVEPAKPAPEPLKSATPPVPAAKSAAPMAKPEPAPAKPAPAPATPAAKPAGKLVTSVEIPPEDGTPAAPLVPEALATPKHSVAVAPPTPAPAPTPTKPAGSVPALIPSTPAIVPPPVPAANPPAVSVTTSPRNMAQNETTTAVPATARAAAQLTLGFEITSLQLTPFFKLGAVQLRPLSNIVSLHLIASAAADNPLAAGISFQIVTVELNEAAHLKSILLKPLPQAQAATVPSQKLQVDNVQITQAGENAPISVTTSETTSTAVQLLADFTIASMDFTPSFEIGSLRLEPTSNSVLLRLAPSQRPAALDLPPSFDVANVQLGNDAQLSGVRLTPGGAKA